MRFLRAVAGRYAQLPMNAKRLKRATDNIAWCFPDWDEDRVRITAIEAYRHLFSLAVEIAAAPRVLASDGYASFVEMDNVGPGIEVLTQDRPALLVTGHHGNWELMGGTMATLGFPIHALYRKLDMKPLDEWVYRTRSERGLNLIDKFGAARLMPDLMANNQAIAFIADQNAGDRGQFVPFFGRLASAYKAIGVMAQRYNAPIVCATAIRQSGRTLDGRPDPRAQEFRYKIHVTEIIEPEDWADQPDPVFYITARYRRAIENMVRMAPEQYLWMHRYWKSRPRHERMDKPFPDRLKEKLASLPWMTDDELARIVERSERDTKEFSPRR